MDVITAVLTRRSELRLAGPGPSMEEFRYLLRAASCAPDHGRLRPWRWILMSGEARDDLAAALAEDNGKDIDVMRARTRRAPLLAALIFSPDTTSTVPHWEQLAATSGMATSLALLLHARGFGSIWRTGPQLDAEPVRKLHDLDEHERSLGWFYIGSREGDDTIRRRETPDVGDRLQVYAPR